MLFSSMIFLWIFLPAVLIGNAVIGYIPFREDTQNKRIAVKNAFLLIASLIFYAWGGIYYLFLMLAVIMINFTAGIMIDRAERGRKALFIIAICANIALLFYFKYFNLLVNTIESLKGLDRGGLGLKEVVLPIGISFYIFQAMSYTIDLYRAKTPVQRSICKFALYVALFPQLIAGPIVIYNDIRKQIDSRVETPEKFISGIRRFCYGMAKKVLIANVLAEAVDSIWEVAADDPAKFGAGVAWFGMMAYTFQIFYDFSGYSDMAIGLGRMLGFDFKENFASPYMSLSVREFWRRWHISLSSWFRDYVYIPLGGSRTDAKWKVYRNLLIVFLLTGIWHGANYTFFVWGLYYGVLIVAERMGLGRLLDRNRFKLINWLYTIIIVMVGWVFFRSDNIGQAVNYIGRLFAFVRGEYTVLNFMTMKTIIAFIAAILCMGILDRPVRAISGKLRENRAVYAFEYCVQLLLLGYCIISIVSGSYNPFIYFQF